jgi:hypothetical protein
MTYSGVWLNLTPVTVPASGHSEATPGNGAVTVRSRGQIWPQRCLPGHLNGYPV